VANYYYSGIDRASFIELLAGEGAAGMVNATVATQPAMKAAYRRYPEVPLVLDSGAFQGVDDIDWYAEVIHEVGERFEWCANLDVIGDQEASNANWLKLLERDVRTLWVYQVEGGAGLLDLQAELSKWSQMEALIGVGGLVPVIKRSVDETTHLIESVGQILQSRSKAHFFGVSSPRILAEFGREP
jgi:hypothetical protein